MATGGGLSTAARGYIGAISLATILACVLLWQAKDVAISLGSFLLIFSLGMLAHASPIQGFRHQAYQVTLPLIVLAAALFSTAELVAFIVLIHIAEQARLHRRLHIQWFNTCNFLFSAAIAGASYRGVVWLLPEGPLGEVAAVSAAGCTVILLNRGLLAGGLLLAPRPFPLPSRLFPREPPASRVLLAPCGLAVVCRLLLAR